MISFMLAVVAMVVAGLAGKALIGLALFAVLMCLVFGDVPVLKLFFGALTVMALIVVGLAIYAMVVPL